MRWDTSAHDPDIDACLLEMLLVFAGCITRKLTDKEQKKGLVVAMPHTVVRPRAMMVLHTACKHAHHKLQVSIHDAHWMLLSRSSAESRTCCMLDMVLQRTILRTHMPQTRQW